MPRDPRGKAGRLPRRGTDRLEDAVVWLLVLAGLATLVLGLVVLFGTSASVTAQARQERADRTQVTATVVDDAPAVAVAGSVSPHVLADVTWTDPTGATRWGPALVPVGTRAGQTVLVWLDGAGGPVDEPTDPAAATPAGIAAGSVVLLAGGIVLLVGWLGARHWIAVLNDRGWEREWARVGPEWTGHGRQGTGMATD